MNTHARYGFKWSVNEILSLQREYELLGWSIDEIAEKHKRTPNAIMYKLDEEGFADYNVLYSNYNNLDTLEESSSTDIWLDHDDDDNDESEADDDEEYVENADCEDNDDEADEDDEVANLSERVDSLEESISEIRDMLKQMMSNFNKPSTIKRLF